MNKFRKVILLALGTAAIIAGTISVPAQAAPPPPGYPSNEVLGYGQGSAASYVIRRGFYDSDADQGFGFDKAYHKHGIYSVGAISWARPWAERNVGGKGPTILPAYTPTRFNALGGVAM